MQRTAGLLYPRIQIARHHRLLDSFESGKIDQGADRDRILALSLLDRLAPKHTVSTTLPAGDASRDNHDVRFKLSLPAGTSNSQCNEWLTNIEIKRMARTCSDMRQ